MKTMKMRKNKNKDSLKTNSSGKDQQHEWLSWTVKPLYRWEDFRPIIDKAFPVTDPSLGGRPPYDRVLMFKVLVLQRMYICLMIIRVSNLDDTASVIPWYRILRTSAWC